MSEIFDRGDVSGTVQGDRELLELAAKAAGIAGHWEKDQAYKQDRYYFNVPYDNQNMLTGFRWDPLTDDGDALRLAVKLGIAIELHPAWVYARAVMPNDHYKWHEITEGWANTKDPCAATRRAIVRAAARLAADTEGTK